MPGSAKRPTQRPARHLPLACVPTGACASACRMRACARDAALNLAHGQAALSPKFGYCFDGLILANMVLLSLQSADVYQEDDALHLSIGPIGMLFALGSSRCATHACITPPHARCAVLGCLETSTLMRVADARAWLQGWRRSRQRW